MFVQTQQAMSYLHLINEQNKLALNKPSDADKVYYSELNEWYTNNAFRSFSIKMVVQGTIYYHCRNREFVVPENHFLITSKQPHAKAFFDSKHLVKSICIDICPRSIEEAFTLLHDDDPDELLAGYFLHPYFFEKVYPVEGSLFAEKLSLLSRALRGTDFKNIKINEEWFLQLVELIIQQEKNNCIALNGLPAKKISTRKEVYERLLTAKAYMHDCNLQNPEISEIAKHCNLSVFHFFRSFRQAFGITPYQYLMQLRLDFAKQLLKEGDTSITDIAMHCGFPDVFTFSKAFRRNFAVPPSQYIFSSEAITSST